MRTGFAIGLVFASAFLIACQTTYNNWPEPATQELESGRFTGAPDTAPAYKLIGLEGMMVPGERAPADAGAVPEKTPGDGLEKK